MVRISLFLSAIIILLSIIGCKPVPSTTEVYQWPIPKGFPQPQIPENNPMTKAKIELGRYLFYDTNLSANQQQSCASCHQQTLAFSEPLSVSIGSQGDRHRRNAQALVNIAYNKTLTWAHDGLTELEMQILLPLYGEEPIELGVAGHEKEVLARFNTPKYQALFAQAFPNKELSFDLIVKALASFVRSLVSLNSPFDRYAYQNDDNALSESAIRGMNLFFSEQFECHHCHGGFNFTQSTSHEQQVLDRRPFHNTGLYNLAEQGYPESDNGLQEISTLARDNGRFRAPTLRNIEVSGPYMHDGSIATLSEVLDFYAAGGRVIKSGANQGDGRSHPYKSDLVKGFEMAPEQKADLLAFLKTLTDKQFLSDPKLAKPQDY